MSDDLRLKVSKLLVQNAIKHNRELPGTNFIPGTHFETHESD